jgi:hypothetical protein
MYYYKPKFRDIQRFAFDEAIRYYEDKDWSAKEFQAFQQGFIRAYRHAYAKAQMAKELAKLNLA